MKKLLLLLTAFCLFTTSFAAFEIRPAAKKANEIFSPLGNGRQISLMDLSVITIKDFEKFTGKHLSFIDRIRFKSGQKKLRNSINEDGTLKNKIISSIEKPYHKRGFNVGWFLIGWCLSIFGVILAYVIKADNDIKKNRIKSAWLGFGIPTLLFLLLLLIYDLH